MGMVRSRRLFAPGLGKIPSGACSVYDGIELMSSHRIHGIFDQLKKRPYDRTTCEDIDQAP